MRRIVHPGPEARERHAVAETSREPLDFEIAAGETVEAGLARAVAAARCAGAYVNFGRGRFDPFRFVMPAVSPGPSNAAWYSETFAPRGSVVVHEAGAIVGWRDGAPFVHCHGLWSQDGRDRSMGHMLPPDCVAAEPIAVRGIGLNDATFVAAPDPETNFTLFAPKPAGPRRPGPGALAVTVRPNEDIATTLEAIAAARQIGSARVFGIGSLNGARFETGPAMESYASELLIRDGRIIAGDDGPVARLDVAIVDVDGQIFEGVLVRGDNPVCVTFELVVVPDDT